MRRVYFPDPEIGWIFVGLLAAGLAVITVSDTRRAKIPNRMTVPLFLAGIVANAVRGALVASRDIEVWKFGVEGSLVGVLDGVVFAFAGALLAFAIFFVMFAAGVCAGGDVKLFTAIGAWIGPYNTFLAFIVTVLTVMVWAALKILTVGWKRSKKHNTAETMLDSKGRPLSLTRLTFSLPATAATILVMLWVARFDLKIERFMRM